MCEITETVRKFEIKRTFLNYFQDANLSRPLKKEKKQTTKNKTRISNKLKKNMSENKIYFSNSNREKHLNKSANVYIKAQYLISVHCLTIAVIKITTGNNVYLNLSRN